MPIDEAAAGIYRKGGINMDPKVACMMDAITTILQASELFEEVTADFTFGCWRIEAIPKVMIPEKEPSGEQP